MMPNVIGWDEAQAEALLKASGYSVNRIEYLSKRGVTDADSTRVIRQRELSEQCVQITVSHFKVGINWV